MSLSVGAAQLMEGGDQTSSLLSIDRVRDSSTLSECLHTRTYHHYCLILC